MSEEKPLHVRVAEALGWELCGIAPAEALAYASGAWIGDPPFDSDGRPPDPSLRHRLGRDGAADREVQARRGQRKQGRHQWLDGPGLASKRCSNRDRCVWCRP